MPPGPSLPHSPFTKPEDCDGGLSVSPEMRKIFEQSGYLTLGKGGQRGRDLYKAGSINLDAIRLSPFGCFCYVGELESVEEMYEAGAAPSLSGTETPYKLSYASLIVVGAQRIECPGAPERTQHLKILKYLVSKGLSVDVPDIAGQSALSLASSAIKSKPEFVRALIEAGADVNQRDRYGEIPILGAMQANNYRETDILLEHGSSLDIPDASGRWCARNLFMTYGPQITAVVRKHIQKQEGTEAPRAEKCCDLCRKENVSLKNCARCRVARYCSAACQKQAWPLHKKTCEPFGVTTTVAFKPVYHGIPELIPIANLTRQMLGIPVEPAPPSHKHSGRVPSNLKTPKQIVIKVQVCLGIEDGDMLVYTKSRDFLCRLRRVDEPTSYDRLTAKVKNAGVGGMKGYFAAELRSKNELVVKVSEILAEQPF